MSESPYILLVDDNPDDVDLTILALKRSDLNCEIVVVRDGIGALRQHPLTKSQPVVILTSSREEHDIAERYANGAKSSIRKPLDYNNFTADVKHLGLYWMVWNERPIG